MPLVFKIRSGKNYKGLGIKDYHNQGERFVQCEHSEDKENLQIHPSALFCAKKLRTFRNLV